MRERAEHPADRVPELAIGIDVGLQDLRADPEVLRIVGRDHPEPEDVGARLLDHLLRRHLVAERLRHLAAVLGHDEAVRQHRVIGRAAARAAAFKQRGVEPAAMLVGAFEIERGRPFQVRRAPPARRRASSRNRTRRRECRRPSPSPPRRRNCRGSAPWRRPRTRRRRPPRGRRSTMRALTASSFSTSPVSRLDEDGDRHAPGALARHHPVGAVLDHAAQAVLPGGRHEARVGDRLQRAGAQRVAASPPIGACPCG